MRDYRYIDGETISVIEGFPMPTAEEKKLVNNFFTPYIFFREDRDGRWLTTSCCNRAESFYPLLCRTETGQHYELITGKHNDYATCPYCGKRAQLKHIGKLGKRKKLLEYIPVVFLREREGGILALTAWTRKDYLGPLEEEPLYMINGVYHFEPGRARFFTDWYGKWEVNKEISGDLRIGKDWISEPFTEGSGMMRSYCSYRVIGLEAIQQSAFRWCQYEKWHKTGAHHSSLMRYLMVCCFYGRNVEMLIKCGMEELVEDLIWARKKNAEAFKWGEEDPRKAFRLDGQKLKEFLQEVKDLRTLCIYKQLERWWSIRDFGLARRIAIHTNFSEWKELIKLCRVHGIKPGRLMNYFERVKVPSRISMFRYWKDYVNMAECLGYDLENTTVLLPKDLIRRHDEAAAEQTRRLELAKKKENEKLRKAAEESLNLRREKYNFDFDGFYVRIAETVEEIVEEGKVLEHCVGGYASRHMNGVITILFMRKICEPEKPFVTIEVCGNNIRQAHGYKNDLGRENPLKVHKEFFDTWLDWLKRGSPRTETGEPKLRKKKGARVA